MKQATICYCLKDRQVLLGLKKKGFGQGKWNGYGGKLKAGETPSAAAVRELEEESGLVADSDKIEQVALLNFSFDKIPVFQCFVFLVREFQGNETETDEMSPKWFSLDNLPFKQMWVADRNWLPLILAGQKIISDINFNAEGTEVENFKFESLL
jgi:8-oxo-dGTP pyrophosphatase MutT (NUDIX family)